MAIFCAAFAGCVSRTQTTVLTPPETLLAECPEPTPPQSLMEGSDVRAYAVALTRWNIDIRESLAQCNADKRGLREWVLRMRKIHDD